MATKKENEMNMDQAYKKLQEIIEKMEEGNLGLEENFRLYEEGLKYVKLCSSKLDEIEKKMIVIEQEAEDSSDEGH